MKNLLLRPVALLVVVNVLFLANDAVRSPVFADECSPQRLVCDQLVAKYDGIYRSSRYVNLPNGARIAVDVLRPTSDDVVVEKPMSVLFVHAIYNRAIRLVHEYEVQESTLISMNFWQRWMVWAFSLSNGGEMVVDQAQMIPWIGELVQQGYVVVAADASGTGASFGQSLQSAEDYRDESSLLMDWIVAQPWSDGTIGVFGQSFHALTAYAAMSSQHPALKAAFVSSPPLDAYRSIGFPGGVGNIGFGNSYMKIAGDLDLLATPVEGDVNGVLFKQAMSEREGHRFSDLVTDVISSTPFQDGVSDRFQIGWDNLSGLPSFDVVHTSGIPVFNVGGFRDMFTKDTIFWHENLQGPKKLVMRPWHHRVLNSSLNDFDPAPHAHAWFDKWLKNEDGLGDDTADVTYFSLAGISGEEAQGKWCQAEQWPPRHAANLPFVLSSTNMLLSDSSIDTGEAQRVLTVTSEGAMTSGVDSRWNGVLTAAGYEDFKSRAPGGQSFTSLPFTKDLEIVGYPLLSFFARFPEGEAPVHVVLEKLSATGERLYLSEGVMRPAQVTAGEVVYAHSGALVFDHRAASSQPVDTRTVKRYELDLLPLAAHIKAGEKIRLNVWSADRDNYAPLRAGGPQEFDLIFEGAHQPTFTLSYAECISPARNGH